MRPAARSFSRAACAPGMGPGADQPAAGVRRRRPRRGRRRPARGCTDARGLVPDRRNGGGEGRRPVGADPAPPDRPFPLLQMPICAAHHGAVIADEAGFKPAPGGTLVPGDFPLRRVAVPDGLRLPVATEALIVMPGPGGFTAPWLPGTHSKVPWLASVRDGRTVLAVGDAAGAVRLCDPATRKPYGTLFERPGRPVMGWPLPRRTRGIW